MGFFVNVESASGIHCPTCNKELTEWQTKDVDDPRGYWENLDEPGFMSLDEFMANHAAERVEDISFIASCGDDRYDENHQRSHFVYARPYYLIDRNGRRWVMKITSISSYTEESV